MQNSLIPTYRINAFGQDPFTGNPATVCFLDKFLDDKTLLKLAQENGTSETSFIVRDVNQHLIRWFSTVQEVDLCGHGTLAAAHALRMHNPGVLSEIEFHSKKELLKVHFSDPFYTLNFPIREMPQLADKNLLEHCLNIKPISVFQGQTTIAIFNSCQEIEEMVVNYSNLKEVGTRSIIITAPGENYDYALRYFTPYEKNLEDYVTGVAQCYLAPYWGKYFNKNSVTSKQLSNRQGDVYCTLKDGKVFIRGKAYTYFYGYISI